MAANARSCSTIGPGLADLRFVDVGDVEHRLHGQQKGFARQLSLGRIRRKERAGLALFQRRDERWAASSELAQLRVGARLARQLRDAASACVARSASAISIGDDLDVAQRVGAALDVRDVGIVEAAHDHGDRVGLADVAQKRVAEALARAGAAHQAGDVDEAHGRVDDLLPMTLYLASASSRSSGTGTSPTLGSIVANG